MIVLMTGKGGAKKVAVRQGLTTVIEKVAVEVTEV
jgi:hypothetical protein